MRRLIVCCDGTWKTAEATDITNVVWVVRALLTGDSAGVQQIIYYDRGVGTGRMDRLTGGAFGQGLLDNVKDAYAFICANYAEGDALYFFGFSRGAYTVRSTVGLIRTCGILRKERMHLLRAAYELYRKPLGTPDSPEAVRFREAHSHAPVRVEFLGVWDTVGALGIPLWGLRGLTLRRHQFHDVQLSGVVKRAYQALAIDERRRAFRPSIWTNDPKGTQLVEQVWFSGAHSNVGGGYPDRGLSDLSLLWMLDRAHQAGLASTSGSISSRQSWVRSTTRERDCTGSRYLWSASWARPTRKPNGRRPPRLLGSADPWGNTVPTIFGTS